MADQTVHGAEDVTSTRPGRKGVSYWVLNRTVHRWCGLTAMAWLVMVAASGVILDHPEWRWAQQWTVTERFASDHVFQDETLGTIIRKFQINEANGQELIGGGPRGLWRTADGGASWTDVAYAGSDGTPMLYDLLPSRADSWGTIWLATDDGLWEVSGADGAARPVGLRGLSVTDMDWGANAGEIVGIVDKTRIFRLSADDPDNVQWLEPGRVSIPGLPDEVSLARIMVDLHMRQGFTGGTPAVLINDFGGIAVIILALTGLLYWTFPRLWRNPDIKSKWTPEGRRKTVSWLFRFHGPVIGILAIIPIVYLSVTGIFLDHARAFLPSAVNMTTDAGLAPGPYRLRSLSGEMEALRTDPARPEHLTVLTRMGLIASEDGGVTWAFDETTPFAVNQRHNNPGFVHRGDMSFMGNHGGPVSLRSDRDGAWGSIPSRMMVQDAAPLGDDWVLKGSGGFMLWSPDSGDLTELDIANPQLPGMPVKRFMTDVHSGLIFHDSFVWVNDLAALIAIFMCITGFTAWWRKKWI